MACGDPHLQNFSTCSKWQLTYSICCQHTKECHKPISQITIMSFKSIFHASLYCTHVMYFQRAPQAQFFTWKTNTTCATSPPIHHSHHHAHEVSICFKLLPHPPYFHTHCCNKANHGKSVIDHFWRQHIKRTRISKFGARLGHGRKKMRDRLRWLWEWGWLLGVGGVGRWLFARGNRFWSCLWGGMVEFDEHGGWEKKWVWIRWVWRWNEMEVAMCMGMRTGLHGWGGETNYCNGCDWWRKWVWKIRDVDDDGYNGWWILQGFWGGPCTLHSFLSNKLSIGKWKP